MEKANDDFTRTHEKDLSSNAGDFQQHKFDDTYKPTDSKLPDLSKSQKEWEGRSAHIMKWKKMDEAMRLAAQTGAVHMKGVPVSEAVNKVEHKCDTACDKECIMAKECSSTSFSGDKLAADHSISEADILMIRRHDLVAEQAAQAASMLQKAGWVTKAVGVEAATGVVNKTHTSGPSTMTKIGTQIRGVTSSIGDKLANAKDAVVDVISKDKPISDEQKLKDINRPSYELDSSITTTTTTEQTKMERLSATAASVKDTVYDAGQRATPYLQKAAVAAGQVLKAAGAIAQPIMHHLAQGVAEVTAPQKQSDSLKEEIQMNLKDVQREGEFDKSRISTTEQPGSFRTKPFEPAPYSTSVPLASDTFTQHEVKSRPSSPVRFGNTSGSTIPFNTSTSVTSGQFSSDMPSSHMGVGSGGVPLQQSNTWLPGQDKNFHHGSTNFGYQQQPPIDNTKFSGSGGSFSGSNLGSGMPSTVPHGTNVDYDLQVQNKNNLNLANSNLTANQLQQLRHQQQGQHQHAL